MQIKSVRLMPVLSPCEFTFALEPSNNKKSLLGIIALVVGNLAPLSIGNHPGIVIVKRRDVPVVHWDYILTN